MNDEQTKLLLGVCRPGGRDAADPALAPALEQAARDPRLRAWFERDQAFGAAVAGKLREVAPPADLREAILTGARLGVRTPWWRRTAVLAVAASIALLLALAPMGWRMVRPATSANFPEFAMNFAGSPFRLQEHGADVEKLKAWLAERHAPLPAKIPWELAQLRGLGCRTVDFQGKSISLICFERGGHEYHLFVAWQEDFPELPVSLEPHFQTRGGKWTAAAWSDKQHHYVLVSDAGEAAVRRLL